MYQAEVTSWYGVNLLLFEISVNVLLQNMLIYKGMQSLCRYTW